MKPPARCLSRPMKGLAAMLFLSPFKQVQPSPLAGLERGTFFLLEAVNIGLNMLGFCCCFNFCNLFTKNIHARPGSGSHFFRFFNQSNVVLLERITDEDIRGMFWPERPD